MKQIGDAQDWVEIRHELASLLAQLSYEEQAHCGGPPLTEMPWNAMCGWLTAFQEEVKAGLAFNHHNNITALK